MSLLDTMPHTATANLRTRTKDDLGGNLDTFTAVFTDKACWSQNANDSEIKEFDKRGISVTNKVYFNEDPSLTEKHELVVIYPTQGVSETLVVRSRARPDASAGLGVVWRIMAERKTTEG